MSFFGSPKYWKIFKAYFVVCIGLIVLIGWEIQGEDAALGIIYGGLVAFFYLSLLVLTAKSYGDRTHLFLQILSGLRLPIVSFALAWGYFAQMLAFEWTLAGFFSLYPLILVYCRYR